MFSRMVSLQPLRKKNKELTKIALEAAVKKLSKGYKRTPVYLVSDQGLEWCNRTVQSYLKKHGIHHYTVKTGFKSSYCEIFNRHLESWLYKYMLHNKTKTWYDQLSVYEKTHNNRIHSTTLFAPSKVSDANADLVFSNAYRKLARMKRKPPKFQLNDAVRIAEKGNIFAKRYKPTYSERVYYVHKVVPTWPVFTYRVVDSKGVEVEKTFTSQELSPAAQKDD